MRKTIMKRKKEILTGASIPIGVMLLLAGIILTNQQVTPAGMSNVHSFGSNIKGSFIIPVTQTYLDAYLKWDVKQINDTRFNVSFYIADPFWSDAKGCLAMGGASKTNCLKNVCSTYLSSSGNCTNGKFAIDMQNMTNYPLKNLTAGIKLSGRVIDLSTGRGWFYMDFPNGFKENEKAITGFGSTTFTTFSTDSVNYIRSAIVDDNHFVIGWGITGYKYRQAFNTNGTNSTPVITIESLTGTSHSYDIDIACGSSTLCAQVWYNYNYDNTRLQFFDPTTGANVSPAYTVQHVINSLQTTVTFINSTDVINCFHASPAENCTQFHHTGLGLNPTYVGSVIAMTGVGAAGTNVWCKVDAFNSSAYVVGCGSYTGTQVNATALYINGTVLMANTQVEGSLNQYAPAWVSTNNWQNFTIFYHDSTNSLHRYAMYYSNGTQILAPTTVQSSAGTSTGEVMSGSFNSTDQLLGWWAGAAPYDDTFGDYGSAGTAIQGPFKVDNSSTGGTIGVVTRQQAVGLRFCSANDSVNQYLIFFYKNSSSLTGWISYYSNGTPWNGVCPAAPVAGADFTKAYSTGISALKWTNLLEDTTCQAPDNQTDPIGVYNITSSGTGAVTVQLKINQTLDGITLLADDDNTCAGAVELTTSYQTVLANLAQGDSGMIWMWMTVTTPGSQRAFKLNFTHT